MVSPRYDSSLAQNANLRQGLADPAAATWLGGSTNAATASPVPFAVEADSTGQPLMVPGQAEPSPASAQPGLEVERSESTVAPPVPPEAQTPAGTYPMDLASTGFHPTSRVDDAFPLFFGAVFVLILGSVVIKLVSMARRETADDGFENVFGSATSSPRFAMPPAVPPIAASESSIATFDDPLHLAVGDVFALDLPDYAGTRLIVERIEQYITRVGGQSFSYAAYWARNEAGGSGERLQLRVERLSDGGLVILALHIQDEMDYSQELYNIVESDRTGLFQITDDNTGEVTAEYRRPEGVLGAFDATVVTPHHPANAARRLRYWDYSRQADTPQGTIDECLIVEMEASGRFRILLGPQIDSASITPATTP